MAPSKLTLLDLPNEILLSIVAYSTEQIRLGNPPSLRQRFLAGRYVKLCRVCKVFYYLLNPAVWRIINSRLTHEHNSLYASICMNPVNATLVQQFKFIFQKGGADEGKNVRDRFSFMAGKMINLRSLSIYFNEFIGNVDATFLCLPKDLEELQLLNSDMSPLEFDQLFHLRNLKTLELSLDWHSLTWSMDLPTIETAATALLLRRLGRSLESRKPIPTWGVPNRILEAFLGCPQRIERLEVPICADAFREGELDSILTRLAERSRLKSIALASAVPFETRRLGIDMSIWQYLETLRIDSVIIWPLRNSWNIRKRLYKALPHSLKSLHIRFPQILGSEHGLEPYDGVFQSIFRRVLDRRDHPWQEIPEGRFDWFLNLLENRSDAPADSIPYLPNLEKIKLEETQGYAERSELNLGGTPYSNPYQLPEEIAVKFSERGIEISILAVDYENGWDY